VRIQEREQARADQQMSRSRQVVGITSTVFIAAQAALVASVNKHGFTAGEARACAYIAVVGLVVLVAAVVVLLIWGDAGLKMRTLTGQAALDAWTEPDPDDPERTTLEQLAVAMSAEADSWMSASRSRSIALNWLAGLCGTAMVLIMIELIALFLLLTN
jgi:predicted PurR-regulated permease PerM